MATGRGASRHGESQGLSGKSQPFARLWAERAVGAHLVPADVGDVLGEPGDEFDGIGAEHIGVAHGVLSGGLVVSGV